MPVVRGRSGTGLLTSIQARGGAKGKAKKSAAEKVREAALLTAYMNPQPDNSVAKALLKVDKAAVKTVNTLGVGKPAHTIGKALAKAGAVATNQVVPRLEAPLDPRYARGGELGPAKGRPNKASVAGIPVAPLGNLLSDIADAGLGFPGGVAELAVHPVKTVKAIGKQYARTYSPLIHGDFHKFAHDLGQHPLQPIVDAWTVATLGAGAGAKVGVLRDVPKEQFVHYREGQLQQHASPNYLARRMQQNRLVKATANPEKAAKVIGKGLPYDRARSLERLQTDAVPYAQAVKKLSASERSALTPLARYGDKAPERIAQEIAMRENALTAKFYLGKSPAEQLAQRVRLHELRAALPHIVNPSENLIAAHAEGRLLSDQITNTMIRHGELQPATAADHLHMHSRLVSGGKVVNIPAASPALRVARDRVARLEGLDAKVTARRDKAVGAEITKAQALADKQTPRGPVQFTEGPGHTVGQVGEGRYTPAPGRSVAAQHQPRLERIRAALSVARDDLQRLEAAAVKKHGVLPGDTEQTHLVGGEPTGAGAYYTPDVARAASALRQGMGATARSIMSKPPKTVHQSRGTLFMSGRARTGPAPLLSKFADTIKGVEHRQAVQLARQFAEPLNPARPHGLNDGYVHFNPQGVKLPRAFKEASPVEDIRQMTPRELEQNLRGEHQQLLDDTFPSPTQFGRLPKNVQAKVLQLPKGLAGAFSEEGKGVKMPTAGKTAAVLDAFDLSSNVLKSALIFLKGSYIPANFASNVVFNVLHEGAFAPANLAKAAGLIGDLKPATLARLEPEAGMGGSIALGGRGPLSGGLNKVAGVSGRYADRLPRLAAILHELKNRGYKNDAQINALLDSADPAQKAILNQAGRQAEEAMVRFRGMSKNERELVARAIFVYPWIKGATRYYGRLAVDHPLKATMVRSLGQEGHDELVRRIGRVLSFMDGIIPFGKERTRLGQRVLGVFNPGSITPFGTGAQSADIAGSFVHPSPQSAQAIGLAQPMIRAGIEAATHFNSLYGQSYPGTTSAGRILWNDTFGGAPLMRAASSLANPKPLDPATAGNRLKIPMVGGRLGAALKLAGGTSVPFYLNVAAEQKQSRAEARKLMTRTQKAVEDGRHLAEQVDTLAKQTGLANHPAYKTMAPQVRQAVKLTALRGVGRAQAQDKLGHKLSNVERIQTDLETLRAHKLIAPQDYRLRKTEVQRLLDEIKAAKNPLGKQYLDRALSNLDTAFGNAYFKQGYLRWAKAQFKYRGADLTLPH